MESRALQHWRIVRANFLPSENPQAQVEQSSKRTAARERWRVLQRTFLPESAYYTSRAANTEPSSPRSTLNPITNTNNGLKPLPSSRSSSQRLQAITAQHPEQRDKEEIYVRNISVTDIDSPYRAALSDLADFDWQYSETGLPSCGVGDRRYVEMLHLERRTPMRPTIPQFSTVHYHPNHEAFYDEETGIPVPKSSTMSIKRAGTHSTALLFERSTGLPHVDETDSGTCLHELHSRRKRMVTIRLRNLRLSVLHTVGRCMRRCLNPEVRV